MGRKGDLFRIGPCGGGVHARDERAAPIAAVDATILDVDISVGLEVDLRKVRVGSDSISFFRCFVRRDRRREKK